MFRQYLLTGATGFLGGAVLAELLGRGAYVRALALPGDPLSRTLPKGVEVVEGDVSEEASLEPFFAGADRETCVLHCAGIVSVASRPGERLYRVNVGGTRNILRLCAARGVGRLVYVSSVHAIPEGPKGAEIVEPLVFSPALVRGDYAKSKAMATAFAMNAAASGLPVSVVFPSGIIGPGDRAMGSMTRMLRAFLAGRLPFAVTGGYDFADVRDVARGVVDCAERGRAGQGYVLSGHYTALRDLLKTANAAARTHRRVLCLPAGLAALAAPFAERYSLKRGEAPFFTPYSVSVLRSRQRFSHAKATRAFGYAPRPLSATLRDTALWLRQQEAR